MMTCTSEMSGSASRGIRRRDQIPESTRSKVAMKTRKRLRAHQSIQREITLHASGGVHAEVFTGDGSAALPGDDRDLPGAATIEPHWAFIGAIPFVCQGS